MSRMRGNSKEVILEELTKVEEEKIKQVESEMEMAAKQIENIVRETMKKIEHENIEQFLRMNKAKKKSSIGFWILMVMMAKMFKPKTWSTIL